MEDNIYDEVISNDDDNIPATKGENKQKITSEIPRLDLEDDLWVEDAIYEDIDISSYRPPSFRQDTDLSELTETQIKTRHVIQSLIDTERSYIDCLEKLVKDFQPTITSFFGTRPHVMKIFIYLRLMFIHHVKGQDNLKDRSVQNVAIFFKHFAEQEIVNLYSMYIISYSVAIDILKETEKTKPAFRDFVKAQTMLPIEGLMIRPVQRFPQFILILKDLLKYTSDDDVCKAELYECLALLEHVGHQLNERKRRSEHTLQAQSLYNKLKLKPNAERGSHWLISVDDVRQLSNETNGKQPAKKRRLLLMNACLVSTGLSSKESDDYTFKWSVGLQNLELKEQSMSLIMEINSKEEESFDNLSELNALREDNTILELINSFTKTLTRSYPDLLDSLRQSIRNLQQNIQKTLNKTGIELIDTSRNRTYTFMFENSKTKQDWCADFLISKNMSDSTNNPGWCVQEGKNADSSISPACFIRHMSADVPRQFTKIKCATQVIMPDSVNPSLGLPHLWVCSATEGLGKVSIISFYSGRPNLLESFKASQCEIVCAEMIPCSVNVQHELAFPMDTVWMGTVDSEIIVYAVPSSQNVTRAPLFVFHTKVVVVTIKYIIDKVYAGSRAGTLLIFNRNQDGVWTEGGSLVIGNTLVSSLVSWKSDVWIGCDKSIVVLEADTLKQKAIIDAHTDTESEGTINGMVQIGHCLWVSYTGKTILRLYSMDSRHILQEYDASMDLSTYCIDSFKDYPEFQSSFKHEITSLMSSPGLLWVGTSSGIILNYPIMIYQETGPKIFMKPSISVHGYCGSSKFFSIIPFGSIASKKESSGISNLHIGQADHEENLTKHENSESIATESSANDKTPSHSHVYMTLMPESSLASRVHEDGKLCSSDTFQMHTNTESQNDKDQDHISLLGSVFRKNRISNNPFILQDKSIYTQEQGQQDTSKLPKLPNIIVESSLAASKHEILIQPSTHDNHVFVGFDSQKDTPDLSKRRADSGYGSAKIKENNVQSAPSQNRSKRLLRVPSGGLKRQSAIRKSSMQKTISSVSSRSRAESGSWKIDSTNTYVVISGGDGYRDWKNRQSIQYRNDEALLLAWILRV